MASETSKKASITGLSYEEALEKGISATERGDTKNAQKIFKQTAELYPDKAEAWVWLGGTSAALGDAEAAFEKAQALDPANEEAALGLRWAKVQREGVPPEEPAAEQPTAPLVADQVATEPSTGVPVLSGEVLPPPITFGQTAAPIPVPGNPNAVICPNCSKENSTDQKFCVQCGQDLRAALAEQMPGRDPLALIHPVQVRTGPSAALIVTIVILVLLIVAAGGWYFFLR